MHVKELSEIWNNNNKKGLRLHPRKSVKHKPKPGFKCKNNSAGNESNSWIVSLGLTVWVCRGAAAKRTPDLIGCIHVSLCSPGDWKLSAVPRFTLSGSNCFHSEFLQDIDSSFLSFYRLKLRLHPQCVQYFIALKTRLHTIYVFGVIFILPVLISDFDPLSSSSSTARVMDLVPFFQTGAIKRARFIFLLVMQMYRKTQWFQEHWRKLNIYVPYKTWVKWLNIQRNQRP